MVRPLAKGYQGFLTVVTLFGTADHLLTVDGDHCFSLLITSQMQLPT